MPVDWLDFCVISHCGFTFPLLERDVVRSLRLAVVLFLIVFDYLTLQEPIIWHSTRP